MEEQLEPYLDFQYHGNKEDITAVNSSLQVLEKIMDRKYFEIIRNTFSLQNEYWRISNKCGESLEAMIRLTEYVSNLTSKQE
jgi:hypothetical protein